MTTPLSSPLPTSDHARNLSTLIYVLGIFFPILAPLIIWATSKHEHELIDRVGKEALNFHLSYIIYGCGACFVFLLLGVPLLLIGIPFLLLAIPAAILLSVASLLFNILGAIEANKGGVFRVPLIIRLIQ